MVGRLPACAGTNGMYGETKQILLDVTGLGPDSLHVLVALVLFLMCLLVSRRIGFSLLLVVALQMANELLDLFDDLADGSPLRWADMWIDTYASLVLPTVLSGILFVGRVMVSKRALRRHRSRRPMRAGRLS
jgi:hypothetical protein